ncbi:MAG: hypothetical protein M3P26_15460 [Gemmatimonadota bacterium]|nr:hypothetical protein [Gemmatimonadota bacterium]
MPQSKPFFLARNVILVVLIFTAIRRAPFPAGPEMLFELGLGMVLGILLLQLPELLGIGTALLDRRVVRTR